MADHDQGSGGYIGATPGSGLAAGRSTVHIPVFPSDTFNIVMYA